MAQAKKKTATKTAKKQTQRGKQTQRKCCTRTAKKQQGISQSERMHVYIVTAMAMVAGLLLCANAAMMMI